MRAEAQLMSCLREPSLSQQHSSDQGGEDSGTSIAC